MNEETNEETDISMWHKKPEDLTVSENIAIGTIYTAAFTAVCVGVPAAVLACMAGWNALRDKRRAKKLKKSEEDDE